MRIGRRQLPAIIGTVLVSIAIATAVLGPFLIPHAPNSVSSEILKPPSVDHLLGTDWLGRDVLSRLVIGAQVSMVLSVLAVALAAVSGTALGVISGMGRRGLDAVIMRAMDVILAFPPILLAIVIVALLGPGLVNAMLAIGIVHVPIFTRLVRARTLSLKESEFVEAAIALGATRTRIVRRHLLVNLSGTIVVQATASLAYAILTEATLGFLGLGVQPPTPTWGSMLSDARTYIYSSPGLTIFPGVAIMMTVVGYNLLGDSLRDYFDPRLRNA